jgi:hypothetical protein
MKVNGPLTQVDFEVIINHQFQENLFFFFSEINSTEVYMNVWK